MSARVSSPAFIGRVEELRALEAAWLRARDAQPAMVLVGGEAGIGKTRLLNEFLARCASERNQVLAGGCVPVGNGALPYAPIVEALRALLADLGASAVRELVGEAWPELTCLLPALGRPDALGPLEDGGSPDRWAQTRLFEALLGLLGRLAGSRPLVLVVEDLHWADHSTLDLLAFLVRNLRNERILLVVSYRSDDATADRLGPYLAELNRNGPVERIELPRFHRQQVLDQLAEILQAAPTAQLVDAIFGRSEGNPFFTEELLAAARHGSQQLPTTLRDLLQGRVEVLSSQAQYVLGVAAVAGRRVSHWLLAAVASVEEPQLRGALREAVDGHVLMTQPGEDGYEFRHALLREVIVARLLPGERIRLHAGIASAMAAQPSRAIGSAASVAAELAYHWYAAGDLERALPATIDAAVEAERTLAFSEAFRHYKHALDLWVKVPRVAELLPVDRPALLERAAEAGYRVNADPQAVQLIRVALASVDPTTDPGRAGLLHERLGRYLWLALDGTALSSYEEAVRLLPAGPPSAQRARVLAGYAQMLCVLARYADCQRVSEEALVAARRAGAGQEEGRALAVLGAALTFLGSSDQGLSHLTTARTIAEEQGDVEGLGWACHNLAYANERAGRLNEALAIALEGAERCRQLGASSWQDGLKAAAGDFEFRLGNWDQAGQHLAGVLARGRLTHGGAVQARWDRALLEIACGEFVTARQWLEEADVRVANAGHAQFVAQFAGPLALARTELTLWEGRDEEAFRTATDGLAASSVNSQAGRLTLFALGMAAAANRADRARAHRDAAAVKAAEHDGDQLFDQLQAHASDDSPARGPELAAVMLQCRAERARLHGHADPDAWAAAAACWDAMEQPYPASRARFRQAEALLAIRAPRIQVEEVSRMAHAVAARLGAAPLQRELESLARRGRLRLLAATKPAAGEPQPASIARSLGLTRREAEVLALVAEGRTNRQIGQALFITEGTAGVHVSRILAKLGVAGRGEAAAIAHRLGLDRQ